MNRMKQWNGKVQDEVKTVSLTMLLVLNLFGIVMAVSAVATALVLLEVDGGFLYRDGHIGAGGALGLYRHCCQHGGHDADHFYPSYAKAGAVDE